MSTSRGVVQGAVATNVPAAASTRHGHGHAHATPGPSFRRSTHHFFGITLGEMRMKPTFSSSLSIQHRHCIYDELMQQTEQTFKNEKADI